MEIKKIYFDMDGVLANFDKGVIDYCKMAPIPQGTRNKDEEDLLWSRVSNTPNFYYKLDFIDGSKDLFLSLLDKYKEKIEILTGIPKPHRKVLTAGDDKIRWVKDYLSNSVKVNVCLREEKIKFAIDKNYILIDDYQKNIIEWENAGGTGILFTNPKEVLEKISKIEKE